MWLIGRLAAGRVGTGTPPGGSGPSKLKDADAGVDGRFVGGGTSDPVELGQSDFANRVVSSLLDAAAGHPWAAAFVTLLVLLRLVEAVRSAMHGRGERDPQRLFAGADRVTLMARAGRRCEHHSWLSGRCTTTEGLQADHVHPHSRGGATSIANGQVFCGRHNARKANRIPWKWELDRLARRRQAYFPPGTPTAVVRHRVAERAPQ